MLANARAPAASCAWRTCRRRPCHRERMWLGEILRPALNGLRWPSKLTCQICCSSGLPSFDAYTTTLRAASTLVYIADFKIALGQLPLEFGAGGKRLVLVVAVEVEVVVSVAPAA